LDFLSAGICITIILIKELVMAISEAGLTQIHSLTFMF